MAVQIAVFAPLIRVLDGETDGVVATVQVGDHPYSIASDSAAGKIYVTRTYSNQLMVIDAATNHVSSIEAGLDRGGDHCSSLNQMDRVDKVALPNHLELPKWFGAGVSENRHR